MHHIISTALNASEEKIRTPLPLAVRSSSGIVANTIQIPVATLHDIINEELKCPICLGVIDTTWAVTTCLHRFCSECLQKSLRVNKLHNECPSCRAKLASRRQARPDEKFDLLISLVSPLIPMKNKNKRSAEEIDTGDLSPRTNISRRSTSEQDQNEVSNEDTALSSGDIEKFRSNYLSKVKQMQDVQLFKRTNGLLSYSSKLTATTTTTMSTNFATGTASSTTIPAMSNRGHERFFAPNKQKNYLMTKTAKANDQLGPRVCLMLQPWPEVSIEYDCCCMLIVVCF